MASRRERRHRQTYPGPNPADNRQMVQDIKDSILQASSESLTSNGEKEKPAVNRSSTGSEREMRGEKSFDRDRPESRDSRERKSPLSDREQASPGATPRAAMQQNPNRATPTKQISQPNSDRNKQLRAIRISLRPYDKYARRSDPGFHAAIEQVNKTMLEQLISYGHSEVSLMTS